ncbi:MAG TPA: hypothetical protein VJY63_07515 [Marinospirillum sp.]|uniref:hypothetical protein n=1 Tax=Marinospirillum sp. TaxID=2183934 RepID=UPI002B494F13|nr:hypothetical protein [Marinospirillum sp.]HKM15752.1 hypothetical protein [Marinospirillum sp.]
MPNRKEPRLEIEEQPLVKSLASDTDDQAEAFLQGSASSSKSNPKPSEPQQGSSVNSPKSASGKAWLGIFLALIALGLLAWQFLQLQQATQQGVLQQQSMQLLGNRIQELESILLTTGNDLSEAGKMLNEKLEWADSEIRKLWVIAHQRNRPAIDVLETKIKQLEEGLNKSEQQLAEALDVSKTAALASKAATEQNLVLANDLNKYSATLNANTEKITVNAEEVNVQLKGLMQRLTEVSLTASTLDERLRNQDLRTDWVGLEKRVAELSSKTPVTEFKSDELHAKLIDELTAQVAEQQEILASLEASRGQLVGRVTRLMEEVQVLQQAR